MPALKAAAMAAGSWTATLAACPGCGVNLHREPIEHRPDCTTEPSPLLCEDCGDIRLPSERSRRPWRYDPKSQTYHCPNHPEGTTA